MPLSAYAGHLTRPIRLACRWFAGFPRWFHVAIGCVALTVAGVGAAALVRYQTVGRRQHDVSTAWARFDSAVRSGKESDVRAALDDVLASDPTNAVALRRKHVIDTGNGDPDDGLMLPITLRRNLQTADLAAASREAEKLLTREPRNWFARCVVAAAAADRGDQQALVKALDALPPPDDPATRIEPSGLRLAFQLYRATGRDAGPLRAVVQLHLVASARTPAAQRLGAAEKIVIVECYVDGFEPSGDRPQPLPLLHAWATMAGLADAATVEAVEAGSVPVLVRAGRLGARLEACLLLLRRDGHVTEAQFADFARELSLRTRRAWEAVLDRDPRNPEAYRGLAYWAARAGDTRAAIDWVTRGLATCDPDPELELLFGQLLRRSGRPLDAWTRAEAAARANPDKPVWWGVAIEAALAAGRRELAMLACSELKKAAPGSPNVVRIEAKLLLDSGDAAAAAARLGALGDAAVAADPDAVRIYVQALLRSGAADRAAAVLGLTEANGKTPALLTAALMGVVDAPPDAGRDAAEVRRAEQAAGGAWADDTGLMRALAALRVRVAENAAPAWDPVAVAAAVQVCERLRARSPADPDAAAWLATLRLYGQGDAERALRDLAVLDEADAPAELLGQAYCRVGRCDASVRVLERAVRGGPVNAGVYTQLALAYHGQKRADDARRALGMAQAAPRSPREHADYVAAVRSIRS